MSAIGNYVHFMTSNYIAYGTAKGKNKNFSITPFETYKKQRLNNIKNISEGTIKELETRLKENLPSQENKDAQLINKEVQKRNNYIFELLRETTSTEALKKFFQGDLSQFSNKDLNGLTTTTAELRNLKNKVQEFKALVKSFEGDSTMRTETFQKRADRIITLYNEITGSTESMASDQDISTRNKKSILQKVNAKAINHSFNTTQSAIRGSFGELLVATCGDGILKTGRKGVFKAIKEAVQGENRSKIEISRDAFEGLDLNQIKSFSQTLQDGSVLSFGSSQDKVDVKIKIAGEEILASVKNYNLQWEGLSQWGVHLQTVNLLYPLLAMLDTGYTNHWLNLHAANVQPVKIKNGISQDEVDEGIRFEVLYEAFASGNPLKANSLDANVFVLMDSKTGKLKVINIKELLNDDLLRGKAFKISHDKNITNPTIRNEKVIGDKGADIRIENIINQIHKLKVSVSYDISHLNFK